MKNPELGLILLFDLPVEIALERNKKNKESKKLTRFDERGKGLPLKKARKR